MKKTEQLFRELKEKQLVALLSPESAEQCLQAYEIFNSNGVILEIALRSKHAVAGIKLILKKQPEALLLAGTVMTRQQAEKALQAGASGIVSADYIPEVVDACVEKDVMCIPGGLADAGKQLVQKAEKYGCSLEELKTKYPYQWIYKLFPAFSGNTTHMDMARAWRGPYKDLIVIFTGGVSLQTLEEAVKTEPAGIFCASALSRHIDDAEFSKNEIKKWQAVIRAGRGRFGEDTKSKQAEYQSGSLRKNSPESFAARKEKAGPEQASPRVVTFGELMIRLSPPAGIRLQQARSFDMNFGGAEANVAVSLARFGIDAAFVSALPGNELGDNACDTLRSHGVNTEFILRKGKRMGIYYLEQGAGPRPAKVIYDRSFSAFAGITPKDFKWEQILDRANWFHWTGITPALGDNVTAALEQGLKAAKKKGITVSADLNFRKKLWQEEEAREVMSAFMPYVDILIANEEDPGKVFGIKAERSDIESGKLDVAGYKKAAAQLVEKFSFKKVAITLRRSISASENKWSACLYNGGDFFHSPVYHTWIIDRVGAGDAFAAGLIYSLLTGKPDDRALNFAAAASCLKHSISGDFNLVSVHEVERLAAGKTGGRVQR